MDGSTFMVKMKVLPITQHMAGYNINRLLIIIGFLFLLIGFFMSQKDTYDFQLNSTYIVFGKAMLIRTLGILTVLNGLVYSLIEQKRWSYNPRYKYFGIVLYFISLLIVFLGALLSGESNGLGDSRLFSLQSQMNGPFVLLLLAGIATLFISLLIPLLITIQHYANNSNKR